MRYVLFIFCFFMAACSFAQVELLGYYVTGFGGLGYECINFVGTDSFYFDGGYCSEMVQGKGRCEIRGNMLYLNFEKASELKDSAKLPEIAMSDNKNGNYVLNIQCVNFHADPIGFGAVQITRSNGTTVMLLGDIAGRMSYKINSADLPIQVETKMIAGKTETFKIDNLSDYQVRIFHDDSLFIERLNQGEIWSYEIDELSEDVIVMKPAKTSGEYRRYTKKYNK